ncbi:MAG: hypothetical protein U0746_09580 [Gemmataceae bacterium]
MTRSCWTAQPNETYWIDLALGPAATQLMIDTGLVDPQGQIGLELDGQMFDDLEFAKHLLRAGYTWRRDSSGHKQKLPIGFLGVRLLDPNTKLPVGPAVTSFAVRNFPGIPSRVGVAFFHALTGCRIDWDLSARVWCVECP